MSKFKTWIVGIIVGFMALLGLSRVTKEDIKGPDKDEDNRKEEEHKEAIEAVKNLQEEISKVEKEIDSSKNNTDEEREDRWNS